MARPLRDPGVVTDTVEANINCRRFEIDDSGPVRQLPGSSTPRSSTQCGRRAAGGIREMAVRRFGMRALTTRYSGSFDDPDLGSISPEAPPGDLFPASIERRQHHLQGVPAFRRTAHQRRPQIRHAFLPAREEIVDAPVRGERPEGGERNGAVRAYQPIP